MYDGRSMCRACRSLPSTARACLLNAASLSLYVGRSGSGKTSLLLIAGLLARPDSGSVVVAGADVSSIGETHAADLRARSIGFVFQSFNLLPHLSAAENVELACVGTTAEARASARAGLERVGLSDRVDHTPGQLSGGEQQRVALARALVNGPTLLLADEPTGNLDVDSERLVLDQLRAAARGGCGVLVVSHSDAVAAAADRVLSIFGGRVASRAGSTVPGSAG